jgi:serine/threonine-protein kinase
MADVGGLESAPRSLLGGKYRVLRRIGHGAVGSVYEAEDVRRPDRREGADANTDARADRFAVKVLDRQWASDATVAARFAREGRAAGAVASEHVVRVVDGGSHDGCPYLVMELIEGEDLGMRLRRERRLALDEALEITEQVLDGLAAVHATGIVHRDLKPDNVLVARRPDGRPLAKVVDFGMSKLDPPDGSTAPLPITRQGIALGTPFYMSPEQIRASRDVDAQSDVFSVGAILFECLTGRPPFPGETNEQILLRICTEDAPDVRRWAPDLPDAAAALVSRALARDRSERYPSAGAMLADVRELRGTGRRSELVARRRERTRVLVAAALAMLAGALLTLVVILVGR